MIEVRRYGPQDKAQWDALVRRSRNGLFLFERDYMDYHRDRFQDLSAILSIDGKIVGLFPASIDQATRKVTSHGGLTFGGVVLARELRGTVAMALIDHLLAALPAWGVKEVEVRLLPSFLEVYPSGELGHVLWRRGFTLVRRDLSTTIPLTKALPFNSSKKQAVAKARKSDLGADRGSMAQFHKLLTAVLGERHDTVPVHSLAELEQLSASFPGNILLRSVSDAQGSMLAGALVYVYPTAWHTQYMAASPEGRACGALDLVIAKVIEEARTRGAEWLSFGTSTTEGGHVLNKGLLWQKESFGGRSVTFDVMRGAL